MRRKRLNKDISVDEMLNMRAAGMTNADIANAIGGSVSTVYRYIGAQPPGLRRRQSPPPVPDKEEPRHEEFVEAALVVENRSIGLAGLFAGYRIDVKSKQVAVFVEDGVDALIVPFDKVSTFASELNAICRHVGELRVGNEMW